MICRPINPPGFDYGLPKPGEYIRICASTYEIARLAFINMQENGVSQKTWQFIMCRTQVRGLHGGRMFVCDGWSNLVEAPAIEMECKQRDIELVVFHPSSPSFVLPPQEQQK